MTGSSTWLLYACRSPYAVEAAEIVWRCGDEVVLVDNLPDGPQPSTVGRVCTPTDLDDTERAWPATVPLTTPGHRYSAWRSATEHGVRSFPPLVDPTAVVARTALLAEGTSVNAQAVVGANTELGPFVLVNRSASVGHDVVAASFVTIGPACVLAGHVTLETGAYLGAGAVLAPGIRIGANAVIGAGAVVVKDVAEGEVVVGNPAGRLRHRDTGYGGVSVPPNAAS